MFSSRRTSTTSANRVSMFQQKLASEGELIVNEKLEKKIADLDRLCEHESLMLEKIKVLKKYTLDSLEAFVEEQEREAEKAEKQGNPLMQLLTGGLGAEPQGPIDDEEYFSADDNAGDARKSESKTQPKLLLDTIKLSEKNKINLRLCLELDTPDSKQTDHKVKEIDIKTLEKNMDDIPNPSAAPYKKTKRASKKIEPESEEEPIEEPEIKKAKIEPKVVVSEIFQKDSKKEKKEKLIIKSNKHNIQVIELIKPHMDEIVDMCMTLRAWLESFIQKNKNIGGADFQAELQQETIGIIKAVEDEALTMKELFAAYYIARAGVIEKFIKETYIEDYKNFIVDEDEKMFITIRQCVLSLRNATCSMHTDIKRDYTKLFPSGDQQDASFSMY